MDIESQIKQMTEASNKLKLASEEFLHFTRLVALAWGDPIPLTVEECLEYSRRIRRELKG